MSKVTINPQTKTIWHSNPISGHEWSTQKKLKGFEVSGGGFFTSKHTTLKGAEKEKTLRETMAIKYPFVMPLSRKERIKANGR